eukprot:COSAG02_NODE_7125_length_3170_cov_2.337024_5_plen_76_part_01
MSYVVLAAMKHDGRLHTPPPSNVSAACIADKAKLYNSSDFLAAASARLPRAQSGVCAVTRTWEGVSQILFPIKRRI